MVKKYLGFLGFGFWMAATLLFCVSKYILNIELDANILFLQSYNYDRITNNSRYS